MKTQLYSISKIFTERLMRIPDYQRGFSWTEKELRDFWNDLVQLEDGKNHYTGVLTLEEVPEDVFKQWNEDSWIIKSKNFEPFFIVDGQQRLTTTIILIQAITECITEDTQLNFTTSQEIKKKFIFDSKDGGISRSYLFGYEKDNPSYEFLKRYIFLERSDSSLPVQETIYTHNLLFAKNFFLENLKPLPISQIEKLYQKITQNFLFNIYAISEDIDVFVAFETMNNRGKPLSHLELLKNHLIYITTKFEVEDYEKQKLRNAVNEGWKSVYHYLGRNKDKLYEDDFFLSNHFTIYFTDLLLEKGRDVREYRLSRYLPNFNSRRYFDYGEYLLDRVFTMKNMRNLNPEIDEEKELTIERIFHYVQSLKDSVQLWFYLLNPLQSPFSEEEKIWLERINRLVNFNSPAIITLLLAMYQSSGDIQSRIRLLKALERFMFIFTFTRFRFYIQPDAPKINFLEMTDQLKKGSKNIDRLIKDLDEFVSDYTEKRENFEQILSELKNSGFYRWIGLKYFLYEYEMSLKSRSKAYREKLSWEKLTEEDFVEGEDNRDYITIEHIYPQNPRRTCWTDNFRHYSDKERKMLKNTLGNLVPLSEKKNVALENECFEFKKGREGSLLGFRHGSYSESEIAECDNWTAKEILERGIRLLDFMGNRWNIDLGNRMDKAKFLLIDFVYEKEGIILE